MVARKTTWSTRLRNRLLSGFDVDRGREEPEEILAITKRGSFYENVVLVIERLEMKRRIRE